MNAAGRRQKQAKNNYGHLAPRQRPNYKKRDAVASAKHAQKVLATERRIAQGKRK
jgi:hypothetical protein